MSLLFFAVIEERKEVSDSNHEFHAKLAALSSNQTSLMTNLTLLFEKVTLITIQVRLNFEFKKKT